MPVPAVPPWHEVRAASAGYGLCQSRFSAKFLPTLAPILQDRGVGKRGKSVADSGVLIVTEDTVIRGVRELRNCRQLEVFGYLEGDVAAKSVLVHPNGRLFGKLKSDNAEIHGTLQGEVVVKNLIDIRSGGDVSGNVRYGKLALEARRHVDAHSVVALARGCRHEIPEHERDLAREGFDQLRLDTIGARQTADRHPA